MDHTHALLPRSSTLRSLYTSLLLPSLSLRFSSLANSLQDAVPILVYFQLRYSHFTWRYSQRYALPVALLAHDTLDVDDVFETVDGCDFALAAFVGPAGDYDFIVFADGDRANLPGREWY